MLTDLEALIFDAWSRVEGRIEKDPAELAKRLSRRRLPAFLRPPRAWCLAIRASDRRIDAELGWDSRRSALAASAFATSSPTHARFLLNINRRQTPLRQRKCPEMSGM